MQQRLRSGGSGSPRRRSLDARAEYPQQYAGFGITGKLPAARGPPRDAVRRSLSDGRDPARFLVSRRRTRSVGPRADRDEGLETLDGHGGFCPGSDRDAESDRTGEPLGGGRGARDGLRRRLARVRTELAQADTRLLCERAHSQRLSRQRQEVAEKERSLSRQVDVAVMVIAALKEQINASENELERRERQVLSIRRFLETAARQETSGKVRIRLFIENLLRRIALAESLLEDYQRRQAPASERAGDDGDGPAKSGSASGGSQTPARLCRCPRGRAGRRPDGPGPRTASQERLARSSRLFCRPEHRDDMWKLQRRRSAGYEA